MENLQIKSSGGIANDVPASEVDLSNVSDLTDVDEKRRRSNRAPREGNQKNVIVDPAANVLGDAQV